jgi:6-phosphogluconate dehydrogenase
MGGIPGALCPIEGKDTAAVRFEEGALSKNTKATRGSKEQGGIGMAKADIGIFGLAVMGENLALNLLDNGFTVAVYNRAPERVQTFTDERARGRDVIATHSLREFVESLKPPRRIMLMIRAGSPVDAVIEQLLPLLAPGDILIDGGNSNFRDTIRRTKLVESRGMLYVGSGVSGGEEGARRGPSLMPGGSAAAWPSIKPLFTAIAAKVDGVPCCDWVGPDGSGHYTKMVHNGIEYGDMQLICEVYDLMRRLIGMAPDQMAQTFERWNEGKLESYLIDITAKILKATDADGQPLIDRILDTAGQKGTGKWASIEAMNEGVPLTLIAEAVFARYLSAMKDQRVRAGKVLKGPDAPFEGDLEAFLGRLERALYTAKIASYAQGFSLLGAAAKRYGWDLNYGGIALMWRGGCIIRSAFLGEIKEAFDRDPSLENLMLDPYFARAMNDGQQALREVCAAAALHGVPVPSMMSALAYYDAGRTENLPANLLQAQRDFFGAHTYERVDAPRGVFFHTNWTGEGGETAATTYTV